MYINLSGCNACMFMNAMEQIFLGSRVHGMFVVPSRYAELVHPDCATRAHGGPTPASIIPFLRKHISDITCLQVRTKPYAQLYTYCALESRTHTFPACTRAP